MRPREYLSYSQKSLWKRSPKSYLEKYLYDGREFTTREMAFGKKMAVALEEERDSDDEILNGIMAKLPKLDKPEFAVRADFKIQKELIPLYAKLDTAKEDLSAFKEYKTGKNPWTQRKVDENEQITFYVTLIYILTKQIVQDIELVWVETCEDPSSENGTGISCTGRVEVFKTKRSMGQIINELADIRRVWREIGEACDNELL